MVVFTVTYSFSIPTLGGQSLSCSIDGCSRPVHGRGWCKMHHHRWMRHGDPLGTHQRPSPEERFWAKVDKSGECWIWTGAIQPEGYGVFRAGDGRTVRAHRFSYELANGPIPVGLVLDHLCRTPPCVSPFHLEAVTNRVNVVVRSVTSASALHAAQTHCKRGHLFDDANTAIVPGQHGPHRRCRECTRRYNSTYTRPSRRR